MHLEISVLDRLCHIVLTVFYISVTNVRTYQAKSSLTMWIVIVICDFLFGLRYIFNLTFLKRQKVYYSLSSVQFSSVQSLSPVRLFVTPWTAARQASHPAPTPGAYSNSCPSRR